MLGNQEVACWNREQTTQNRVRRKYANRNLHIVTQVKAALRQQRDSAAECASHTSKHEKKEQAREEQRAARDLQRATNAMCMALMARVIDRPDVMRLLTRQEDDPD